MGCIWSSETAFERSKRIDLMIKQEAERKMDKKEVEILMIGTRYCGKSTLLNHIRTMFGFEANEHTESDINNTVKAEFSFKDIHFKILNLKDELLRNRKLHHYFERITAVIFIVGICNYDQLIDYDPQKNILTESMELFGTICNSKFFENALLFLFLSKTDIFEEKLKTAALDICFPEYSGADTFEEAGSYIQSKFEALKKTDREIYTHFVCIADTKNGRSVTDAVTDAVMKIYETVPHYWIDGMF